MESPVYHYRLPVWKQVVLEPNTADADQWFHFVKSLSFGLHFAPAPYSQCWILVCPGTQVPDPCGDIRIGPGTTKTFESVLEPILEPPEAKTQFLNMEFDPIAF